MLSGPLAIRPSYNVWGITGPSSNLPGVGQNFQDHFGIGLCLGSISNCLLLATMEAEATFFWKSNPRLDTPDLQTCQVEVPLCSAENRRQVLIHRRLPGRLYGRSRTAEKVAVRFA